MILELKKIKSVIVSTFSAFIFHEVMGPDAMILSFPDGSGGRFFNVEF